MTSSPRILLMAAATGAVAVAVAAVSAVALTTKSSSANVPAGEPEETTVVTATCDAGTRAISGGFESADPDGLGGPLVNPIASQREGGRSWTDEADNAGGQDGDHTVYAYCKKKKRGKKGGGLKTRSATTSVEDGELGTVEVKCKRRTKIVSGGFANPGFDLPSPLTVYESRKQGARRWVASGFNSGGDPEALVVFAYCKKGAKALKTAQDDAALASSFGEGTATAQCEPGSKVLSGGFEGDFEAGVDPADRVHTNTSRKLGNGWSVEGINQTFSGPDATLTAYAYCK